MKTDLVHTMEIKLPYSCVSATGQIKMDSLLNLFQDAAAVQCRDLGISGFDLAIKNLKWVVSRYQIRISSTPAWLDTLVLKTWRRPWKNLYELRNFSVTDKRGRELIEALGVWVMIRAKDSKPVRLTPHLPGDLMDPASNAPDLWTNDHDMAGFDHQTRFKIRYHDLDLNQHVNNSVYLKWAMEAMPAEFIFDYFPRKLVISYLKESFYPDMVVSRIKIHRENNVLTSFHTILHAQDNSKLARLTIVWEQRRCHANV